MGFLLSMILACSPAPPEDHTYRSANGRFTLAFTVAGPTLTLRDGMKTVWTLSCSTARRAPRAPECAALDFGADYRIADSGKWVAAIEVFIQGSTKPVLLLDAAGKLRTAPVLEALTEEEQQDFEQSSCGSRWIDAVAVRGDLLDFTVHQGSNRRPTEPAGPTVRVSLDGRTGAVTRGPPLARPSIDALIAQHATEKKPGLAFELLQRKAQLQTSRGSAALCGFFAKFIDDADTEVRGAAVYALSRAKCTQELASLGAPRGDDGDLEQLETLELDSPPKADAFALAVLRMKHPNSLLRTRSAVLLIRPGKPEHAEAVQFALADADPQVKESAVYGLTNFPEGAERFASLLEFAPSVPMARGPVLEMLARQPQWGEAFEQRFRGGKLDGWSGALVVEAGFAERRKDPALARTLYARAATRLEAERPEYPFWPERELWCEATLRLAQFAAEDGKPAVALELARAVQKNGNDAEVAAPDVNRYAAGGPSSLNAALEIARLLIESGGKPVPKPRNRNEDQLEGARLQMEMIRRMAARRDAGR